MTTISKTTNKIAFCNFKLFQKFMNYFFEMIVVEDDTNRKFISNYIFPEDIRKVLGEYELPLKYR